MNLMKIVLASQSEIKLEAVRRMLKAHGVEAELIGVAADSGIAAQPMNHETDTGAHNRLDHARLLHPGADFYIAIENGIFQDSGKFIDRAVIVCADRMGKKILADTDGVEIPGDCVREAAKRGFATTTAGQVMAEKGLIRNANDPHACLAQKPRAEFLAEALIRLGARMFAPPAPSLAPK